MGGLTVKDVDFNGAVLKAAQDMNNIIWVGVSWVCSGMGLNKNQKDRQVKNIQSDSLLSRGCVKFDAGVFDDNNDALALQLDYLPAWLFKINITPKMQEDISEDCILVCTRKSGSFSISNYKLNNGKYLLSVSLNGKLHNV